ncbi:hypothetical protein BKA63DRAFT_68032 [Paraphoma chrysanthemicola]|nr:hypothetical protein BKA63DRAFT_68032 [Paraphoma chrysanthemicola]
MRTACKLATMHEDIKKKPGVLETFSQLALAYRISSPSLVKAEDRTCFERIRNLRSTRLRLSSLLRLTCGRCDRLFEIQRSYRCSKGFREFKYYGLSEDCAFCDILRGCFEHFVGDDLLGHTLRKGYITVSVDWSLELQVCFNITEQPGICLDFGGTHLQLYSPDVESRHHPFKVIDGVGVTPDSSQTVAKVNKIKDCVHTHGCSVKQGNKTFIPTRLIELHGEARDIIRLASPSGSVAYNALSYCWGTSKPSTTTKQNLS